MSDYTPDTETVRAGWATSCMADSITGSANGFRREFDRWLAAHDAEIRADEREKAAQRVAEYADMEGIGLKSWDAAIAAARGEDNGHE